MFRRSDDALGPAFHYLAKIKFEKSMIILKQSLIPIIKKPKILSLKFQKLSYIFKSFEHWSAFVNKKNVIHHEKSKLSWILHTNCYNKLYFYLHQQSLVGQCRIAKSGYNTQVHGTQGNECQLQIFPSGQKMDDVISLQPLDQEVASAPRLSCNIYSFQSLICKIIRWFGGLCCHSKFHSLQKGS